MSPHSRLLALLVVGLMVPIAGCIDASEDGRRVIPDEPAELPDQSTAARSSPRLAPFGTCSAMESQVKDSLAAEAMTELLQWSERGPDWWPRYWLEDCIDCRTADAADSSAQQSQSTQRVEGEDFSGTNNQEEGVDEADFVKTDGWNLYVLRDNLLNIMAIPEFGELEFTSSTPIEGNPSAMLLDGDRLIVISSVSPWDLPEGDPLREMLMVEQSSQWGIWWRVSSLTKLTVLDIGDPANVSDVEEFYVQGNYRTAREVDGSVRVITFSWMDVPGLQTYPILPDEWGEHAWNDWTALERDLVWNQSIAETIAHNAGVVDALSITDMVPSTHERRADGTILTHMPDEETCADISASADATSRGFTSVWTVDLTATQPELHGEHILSNWGSVIYASSDVLVVAEQSNDWWWFWRNPSFEEATNLHIFDITDAATTDYIASGRIRGTVLNQFSLSWYDDVLRVATTTGQWGRWWITDPEPMMSHVITLEIGPDPVTSQTSLLEVGHVGGIAEGERIWSARFDGYMAYIVTFRQIDPLWTIDLSDPTNPTILGELEVPGVSTYIHPIGDGLILTIGYPPRNADGTGLMWSQTQISLFNVSDPTNPVLIGALPISPVPDDEWDRWSWSSSEATYEHKAFQYWGPKGLLAVPLSTHRYDWWYDDDGHYQYHHESVSKLVLINVSAGGLSIDGEVNHSSMYDVDDERWWWGADTSVRRSTFMGDFVYAIGAGGVTVTNLTTYTTDVVVELPEGQDWWSKYQRFWDEVHADDTDDDGATEDTEASSASSADA